jgi:hypothetical protein
MKTSQREPEVEVLPPLHGRRGQQVDPLIEELSRWMDTKFEIPGLGLRFGLDPLLGLLPGIGDTISAMISFVILSSAVRHNVPRITVARMGLNIAIDYVVGAIPLVGDLFDFAWKANQKNVALIRRSVNTPATGDRKARVSDWLFVGGMMLLLVALLVLCVMTAWYLLGLLLSNLPPLFEKPMPAIVPTES